MDKNIAIPKPEILWDNVDKKSASLNARCMYFLVCAFDKVIFDSISHCLIAHEIWTTLEANHGESSQDCNESERIKEDPKEAPKQLSLLKKIDKLQMQQEVALSQRLSAEKKEEGKIY